MPSLGKIVSNLGQNSPGPPQGSRLCLNLLLRIFQSPSSPTDSSFVIKHTYDRNLLTAAQNVTSLSPVVLVLKFLLMIAGKTKTDGFQTLGWSCKKIMGTLHLGEFARYVLKELTCQDWIREKFLRSPHTLLSGDYLLDIHFSTPMAQNLVEIFCYPHGIPDYDSDEEDDCDEVLTQRKHITKILQNLTQWNKREAWLEMKLMFLMERKTEKVFHQLLDNVAKATIQAFQEEADKKAESNKSYFDKPSVWLIGPFLSSLENMVESRVLRFAAQVLESGNNFWAIKTKEKQRDLQKRTTLLGYQPFISLVLSFLKSQDEQRESLLNSLRSQIDNFVSNAKEDKVTTSDPKLRTMMSEALHLRLGLVGSMFETLQKSIMNTQDWCTLLTQLVSYGVVDTTNNSYMLTSVLDMLGTLVIGSLVNEAAEKGDESRKNYVKLCKNIKREVNDKHSEGIDLVRQLLLLPNNKFQIEVLTVEPYSKKPASKPGCKIATKQKVFSWDILEGHKNPAPLAWPWFSGRKSERKQLKYEEQFRQLLHHQHNLKQSDSYFLESPPIPPEDLEPIVREEEKPVERMEERHDFKKKKASNRGRRLNSNRNSNPTTPVFNMPNPNFPGMMASREPYQRPSSQNWGSYSNQQQQPFYTQQGYPATNRFPGSSAGAASPYGPGKEALTSLLRTRMPPFNRQSGPQNMGGMPQQQAANKLQQMSNQMVRQRLAINMMNRGANSELSYQQGIYIGRYFEEICLVYFPKFIFKRLDLNVKKNLFFNFLFDFKSFFFYFSLKIILKIIFFIL